ncbi:hypothetical protein [Flavobacterium coralii]|uniref:hypothetical protein n=1 Tax=Flavobacterium coralii TaxID=2838017 RepID=UPI000C6B3DCF|nr:hypothetical protein [Flavobacterium sp.]|tara:strand:- start:6344 stop:6700 length:357 start_codon:yes stop_codon:yes gene_type:complete
MSSDFYEWLLLKKKELRLTNKDIGEVIRKNESAVQKAISRQSLDHFEMQALRNYFEKRSIDNNVFALNEPPEDYSTTITDEQAIKYIIENEDTLMENKMFKMWVENLINRHNNTQLKK